MINYIAYYRVSTKGQEVSGLGLQAQKEAVRRYIGSDRLIFEFEEIESGRRKTRPELTKALEYAKSNNATLITAKLDRLSRNAKFLLEILESGVEIIFCDFPDMPKGPMNKFFLTMMAAVAELESGMVSERTKAALKAAKANGVVLGATGKKLAEKNRKSALNRAKTLEPKIISLKKLGVCTAAKIADCLNADGIKASYGGKWHPTSLRILLNTLEIE